MNPPTFKITESRGTLEDQTQRLRGYIYGGMYGPSRMPRGIEPTLVSEFILKNVRAKDSHEVFSALLDVLRFYERLDVLPHLALMLTRTETDAPSISRSCYILQALADLGGPDQVKDAAAYFDAQIVPHPFANKLYALLCSTACALVPATDLAKLSARLDKDVKAASANVVTDDDVRRRETLLSIQRRDLAVAQATSATKTKLAAAKPEDRRPQLVQLYIKRGPIATAYIEVWSARQLRRDVITGNAPPVLRALSDALDPLIQPAKEPANAFSIARLSQAILYLGGQLTPPQETAYKKAQGGANFLWDDPKPPVDPENQ